MSRRGPGLTTHVLDAGRGGPAAGVALSLWRVEDGRPVRLLETETNADGRTDAPLLDGASFRAGVYELVFEAGAYLRRTGQGVDPQFLDRIAIRVTLAEDQGHYHVPLLLSPYAYSTYRGS